MFNHTQQSVRKLICSDCGKYLSVTPVKVKDNGHPICGRCVADNCDTVSVSPLTAIIKSVEFPCSNDRYGCTDKVNWENAYKHENSCKYAQIENKIISTLNLQEVDGINCENCKNLLNVSPIHLTSSKKLNCGRCRPKHIQKEEDSPKRLIFLEQALRHLTFPCKYSNQDCKKLLLWDQVEKHEIICNWRNFHCPSLPQGNCNWSGPVASILNHFKNFHQHMVIMDEPLIELDLHTANQVQKLFYYDKEMFLLLLKVSLEERMVSAFVRYLGDSRLAPNFHYRMVFSDKSNIEEFASRKKDAETSMVLHFDKPKSICTKIDTILVALNEPTKVMCSVAMSMKRKKTNLEHCKYDFCDYVGMESDIEEHEKMCPVGLTLCKWPNCVAYLPLTVIKNHENNCDTKVVPCDWSGCTKLVRQVEISNHHDVCSYRDGRIKTCSIKNCSHSGTVITLLKHLREEHPGNLLNGETYLLHSSKYDDAFYVKCSLGLFYCQIWFHNLSVDFYLKYLGKNHKYFQAILKFINGKNEFSVTINKCHKFEEIGYWQPITLDLQKFVHNDTLTYAINISENSRIKFESA